MFDISIAGLDAKQKADAMVSDGALNIKYSNRGRIFASHYNMTLIQVCILFSATHYDW